MSPRIPSEVIVIRGGKEEKTLAVDLGHKGGETVLGGRNPDMIDVVSLSPVRPKSALALITP